MRTTDLSVVKKATDPWIEEIKGFYPEDWLSDEDNVALTNCDGDVALFERQTTSHKTVCGHYFFLVRGKKAKIAAEQFLEEIFTGPYGVEIIVGLTPLYKKGALWMNKHLGFKSSGQIDTIVGPCEFVMLTKQEWENSR